MSATERSFAARLDCRYLLRPGKPGGALVVALYLRHGFPLLQDPGKPEDIYLLLFVTLVASLAALPLMHTHLGVWRFTSTSDLAKVMIAVALVVLILLLRMIRFVAHVRGR